MPFLASLVCSPCLALFREYKDTGIQGYRIQEYRDSGIQGYRDTGIQGYRDTGI